MLNLVFKFGFDLFVCLFLLEKYSFVNTSMSFACFSPMYATKKWNFSFLYINH